MLECLVKNLPQVFLESSGANTRDEFRENLCESSFVVAIVEACAYEAQCIEEERTR
jgi:hypothetical protein